MLQNTRLLLLGYVDHSPVGLEIALKKRCFLHEDHRHGHLSEILRWLCMKIIIVMMGGGYARSDGA